MLRTLVSFEKSMTKNSVFLREFRCRWLVKEEPAVYSEDDVIEILRLYKEMKK